MNLHEHRVLKVGKKIIETTKLNWNAPSGSNFVRMCTQTNIRKLPTGYIGLAMLKECGVTYGIEEGSSDY